MNYRLKEFRVWTFGGVTYTRKADVVDKFRAVRAGARDDAFMRDLLARHKDYSGGEIVAVRFVPHETESFGSLGMLVDMADGTMWAYPSYKGCLVPDKAMEIDGGADWQRKYAMAKEAPTMRMTIQYQLDEFRAGRQEGDNTCDRCGDATPDGDVDHITPFNDIYLEFLEHHGLAPGDIVFETVSKDGMKRLANCELRDAWDVFHQTEFNPQWLCKPCHRRKTHE